MKPGLTLYVVRHGETDWNAARRYQGQRDIPLNEKGRSQAARNGRLLKGLIRDTAAVDFVASPLCRARETMAIVRAELGLPPDDFAIDDRLKEVHYGHWEGQSGWEIAATDPEGYAARERDPFRWRPRGGESYAVLMARVAAWLAEVARDTVVVTHGGVSRALRGHLFALDPAAVNELPVPQHKILVLRRDCLAWV